MNIIVRSMLQVRISGSGEELELYNDFVIDRIKKGADIHIVYSGPERMSINEIDKSRFVKLDTVATGEKKRLRSLLALQKFLDEQKV